MAHWVGAAGTEVWVWCCRDWVPRAS